MKPSKLQFENQPRLTLWGHRSQPWQTMLGVVSLCVMMAFLIQLSGKIWQTRQATQDLNQQAQQLLAKSGPRAMPKPGNTDAASATQELSKEQRQQVNRVIHQLNTPWQDLFQQLERGTPNNVALISIEPDAGRASVKLQAEAKNLDILLDYAASLQSQQVLGALTYSKHETNDQDPNKPVRLSFEMGLRMPARLMPYSSTETRTGAPARASNGMAGDKP